MNLITVVLDTFRPDIIGAGKKLSFVETPNLDKLAEESIVFNRAFGEGQPTLQIRRAFYTGRRSFPFIYNYDRRGHWHHAPGWHKIPPEQDTLAEVLTARGYYTGLVADVYHMFKPTMNYWRGFASYEFIRGQESDNWKGGSLDSINELLKKHARTPDNPSNKTLIQYLLNQKHRKSDDDYQTGRVFNTAMNWLDDNAYNKPFMLWVEAFDPHEPWDPPKRLADRYCPDYDGLDFIMPGDAGKDRTDRETERIKALYYGEVTFIDEYIGKLLAKIESLSLQDDTIIAVLSDHGTQVHDHGGFGKGSDNLRAYQTGIVWQMKVPGMKAKNINALVQSHDVMPTFLDLLDIPYNRMDGKSVMPVVKGETEIHRSPIVTGWAAFTTGNAGAAASVRTDEWNYIRNVHNDEMEILYDLKNDPEENDNVAADHPDIVKKLKREIEAVVGQPLPATMVEVCDPFGAPMHQFLTGRGKRK